MYNIHIHIHIKYEYGKNYKSGILIKFASCNKIVRQDKIKIIVIQNTMNGYTKYNNII